MLIGCNPKQKVLTNLIQDKKPASVVEVKAPPIDWEKMREQNPIVCYPPQTCQTREEYEEEQSDNYYSYRNAFIKAVIATAYYGYWFWQFYKLFAGFINQELEFQAMEDEIDQEQARQRQAQAQSTDYKIVPSPSIYNPEIRVNLPIVEVNNARIYLTLPNESPLNTVLFGNIVPSEEHKEYPVILSRRHPVTNLGPNTVARRSINLNMLRNLHEREIDAEREWLDMFQLIDEIEWETKQTEYQARCVSETDQQRRIWEARWIDNAKINKGAREQSILGTTDRRKAELAECESLLADLEYACSRNFSHATQYAMSKLFAKFEEVLKSINDYQSIINEKKATAQEMANKLAVYKQKALYDKLITGRGDIQPLYDIEKDIKTNNDRETALLRERQIAEENAIGNAINEVLRDNDRNSNSITADGLVARYDENPMADARRTINNMELINQLGMMAHTTLETEHLAQIGFLHLCQDQSVMTRFYDFQFRKNIWEPVSELYDTQYSLYLKIADLLEKQEKERIDMIKRHHETRMKNRIQNDETYHNYLVQRDSNSLLAIKDDTSTATESDSTMLASLRQADTQLEQTLEAETINMFNRQREALVNTCGGKADGVIDKFDEEAPKYINVHAQNARQVKTALNLSHEERAKKTGFASIDASSFISIHKIQQAMNEPPQMNEPPRMNEPLQIGGEE
jgi:hypothetical protein